MGPGFFMLVPTNLYLPHRHILFQLSLHKSIFCFVEGDVLQCSGQLFGRGPVGATLRATACVVINHAVTLRLSGLSTTLAAWGLGTSGGIWGRQGETTAHSSPRDSDQTCCFNLTSPAPHPPLLLTSGVPADPAWTKGVCSYYMTLTLWGTVNRGEGDVLGLYISDNNNRGW